MSQLQISKILGNSCTTNILQFLFKNYLIYKSGSHIIFYNTSIDEQQTYIHHHNQNITCMALSPYQESIKGIMIAVGDQQRYSNITIYNVCESQIYGQDSLKIEMKVILKGHKNPVGLLQFTPDNRYLVSISNKDGSMFLWDVQVGDRLTQNKNSRNINALKFSLRNQENNLSSISIDGFSRIDQDTSYNMVTIGKGHCKVWLIKEKDVMGVNRIQQEQHWMLTGKTVAMSKKLALKQFVDIEIWKNYILLLTSDGLLCLILKGYNEYKFSKCIDLMIQRASSLQVYENTVLCGGDNSLVKFIDLEQLTLISKLPKPPPRKKENVSKQSDQLQEYQLAQNQQFPRCIGIRYSQHHSPLTNTNTQLISTLYENQTIFVWKICSNNNIQAQKSMDTVATGSVISHQGPIDYLKILQYFPQNNLTFFATVSNADNTIRIWHIYSRLMYNRQSVDLAEIIGVKRNVYCRNLTRIMYLETEWPIIGLAQFNNIYNTCRGLACITKNQLIIYSLQNYEIICHQNFEQTITQLQIIENLLYVALQNNIVMVYQLIESLNKIREIEFQLPISKIRITSDNKILIIHSLETHKITIYSLTSSQIIYQQTDIQDFSLNKQHIQFIKSGESIKYYHISKKKVYEFLSLKHQLSVLPEKNKHFETAKDTITNNQSSQQHNKLQQESLTKIRCNSLYVVVLTSFYRIIICNFSGVVIAISETNERINDFDITEGNQIILVGNCGNVMIYNFKGTQTFHEMGKQMKNWIQKNDLSWMEGSIWAKKKSSQQLAGSISRKNSNNILIGSGSIRLATSIKMHEELPNVQIKYQSDRNDKSIFNPSDICQQANQIYKQMDNIMNVKKAATQQYQNQSLQEINLQKNQVSSSHLPPKKRIFGLNSKRPPTDSKVSQNRMEQPAYYNNNLVTSVIHSDIGSIEQIKHSDNKLQQKKELKGTFSQFEENSMLQLSPQKTQTNLQEQRILINNFQKMLERYQINKGNSLLFYGSNSQKLANIHKILHKNISDEAMKQQKNQNKSKIINKYNEYMNGFKQFLQKQL